MKVKAKVYKKNGKPRKGKGFSRKELEEAGISIKEALKLGIPIDKRRSSAYKENIETLKSFLEAAGQFEKKEKAKRRKSKTENKKA